MKFADIDMNDQVMVEKLIRLPKGMKEWLDNNYPRKASAFIRGLVMERMLSNGDHRLTERGILQGALMRGTDHLPDPDEGKRWTPVFIYERDTNILVDVDWEQTSEGIE